MMKLTQYFLFLCLLYSQIAFAQHQSIEEANQNTVFEIGKCYGISIIPTEYQLKYDSLLIPNQGISMDSILIYFDTLTVKFQQSPLSNNRIVEFEYPTYQIKQQEYLSSSTYLFCV